MARRLELPPDCRVGCREGISLNLFEFLGGIISVWVEILAGRVPPGSCLLAQGDSTSATGWLRKSNFSDNNHRLQLEAARHLAFILLDAGVVLYSQWFAGKTNGMSDSLSRDTHLSARELTSLCSHFIPSQVPPNLEICPLPPVVSSWVISLLRSQPPTKASRKAPTRSTLWHGRDGPNGCRPWSFLTMNSSRPSSPAPGRDTSAPLPPQSDLTDLYSACFRDSLRYRQPCGGVLCGCRIQRPPSHRSRRTIFTLSTASIQVLQKP